MNRSEAVLVIICSLLTFIFVFSILVQVVDIRKAVLQMSNAAITKAEVR